MWYVHSGPQKVTRILWLLKSSNYTAVSTFAQLPKLCPSHANGACYSVSVPDATAAGSQTDIYIQIEGPSTGWIGLGQGGQNEMRNSNIFIVYPNASGSNVTLSARLGVGEIEPKYNSKAQVSLLDGSGISNGKMTANIRCTLFFLIPTHTLGSKLLTGLATTFRLELRKLGYWHDGSDSKQYGLDMGNQKHLIEFKQPERKSFETWQHGKPKLQPPGR